MIKARDLDYIETRLLAPCADVSDAHARLRDYTQDPVLAAEADKLMYAMQTFTDICRDIRKALLDRRRELDGTY